MELKNKMDDGQEPNENEKLDIKCNIVRVEYPGLVKSTEKALETLGGLNALERVSCNLASLFVSTIKILNFQILSGAKSNLELNFHPDNYYNKPCIAERDFSSGILIKVTTSKDQATNESKVDYEVIGATCTNFKFNSKLY